MHKFLCTVVGFFAYVNVAQAEIQDLQLRQELEDITRAELLDASQGEEHPRGILDVIENVKNTIEGFGASLLATFDLDGNGRIEGKEEFENFTKTINDVVLLLVDTDGSGSVDPAEVLGLAQEIGNSVKTQVEERICIAVIVEAERPGSLLAFRPLLKQAYRRCTGLE